MEDHNLSVVKRRIRSILMNSPMPENRHCTGEQYKELDMLLDVLESDFQQINTYLLELCKGNFDAALPPAKNKLASRLRDFKSILDKLTWQANQVAKGNYKQSFDSLGGLSTALTAMAQELITKAEKTSCASDSLAALMDDSQDKLLAVDTAAGEVVYANSAAKCGFYNPDTGDTVCGGHCPLLNQLKKPIKGAFEHYCAEAGFYMAISSYDFVIGNKDITVYRIRDLGPDHTDGNQVHNIVYTDFLTGLFNRRYCFELLDKLIKNFTPFTLVVTDLNDLKSVNQSFGHQVGDEYIKRFVACMKQRSREVDTICRAGSDEFVLILPNCSGVAAQKKMESIQSELTSSTYPMSISYGILTLPRTPNPNPKEAFQLTIERMYEMKRIRRG